MVALIYINHWPDFCITNIDATDNYLYGDDAKLFNIVNSTEDQLCQFKELLIDSRIGVTSGYWNSVLINVKTVSYSIRDKIDAEYYLNDGNIDRKIEKLNNIKDLGVTFDSSLTFDEHIQLKINKSYSMLGLIKHNFLYG